MRKDLWKGGTTHTLPALRHANKISVWRQIWCCPHSLWMQSTSSYGHHSPEISFFLSPQIFLSCRCPSVQLFYLRWVSYCRLFRTASIRVMSISPYEWSTTSLSNMCQSLTTLTVKNCFLMFWNLIHFCLCPLPLELSRKDSSLLCIRNLSIHASNIPINLL